MTHRHSSILSVSTDRPRGGVILATVLLAIALLNGAQAASGAQAAGAEAMQSVKSAGKSAGNSGIQSGIQSGAVKGGSQNAPLKTSVGTAPPVDSPGLGMTKFELGEDAPPTEEALLGEFCPEFPGLGCGDPASGACTQIHPLPGCSDCECCAAVCGIEPSCCLVTWDALCVAVAFSVCDTCGSPVAGDCCSPKSSPGCNDADCCTIICEVRPICCEVAWDIVCAQLAAVICPRCAACNNPGAGLCFAPHGGTGCEDRVCCVLVCSNDPYCCDIAWDEICAAEGLQLCTGYSSCLDLGPGFSCFLTHDEPGCSNAGCCSVVCASVPDCCNISWDQTCVETAGILCVCSGLLGGSCIDAHEEPGCSFQPCCDTVCAFDITCCEVSWSADCATLALQTCCGLEASGTCYRAHGSPFCDDGGCCFTVCQADSFCCSDTWDEICAQTAEKLCPKACFDYSGSRECFLPHGGAGCEQASICIQVCELDPLCCTQGWDASCVRFADALFSSGGCPGTNGGCYQIHGGAGCSNELCCKVVCEIDPSCCINLWDAGCVAFAGIVCDVDGAVWAFPPVCPAATGNCFAATATPGCTIEACCLGVCGLDAACCEVAWDAQCVAFANANCVKPTLLTQYCFPSVFSCLSPHDDPYCINAECSTAVCIVDDACCLVAWDQVCVNLALQLCARPCGGLLSGDCFVTNGRPGCDDWDCCERVCSLDEFCCQIFWDSNCVEVAEILCLPPACLIDHTSPFVARGCDDPLIAAAVCAIEPLCCTDAWDFNCAVLAQEAFLEAPACDPKTGGCSGSGCLPSCGSDEAGSCFFRHLSTPSCDDAVCCTTVCEEDCFCCTAIWDEVCAGIAKELCSDTWLAIVPEAGDVCAGSCFFIKPTPFCEDEDCTTLVCSDDEFCCTLEWDLFCVESALFYCLECGDAGSGNCCSLHPNPFCDDRTCCLDVCASDSFCCSLGGQWDATCVDLAALLCDQLCPTPDFECGAIFAGDCCFGHDNPACNDLSCCNLVCGTDPFCCDVSWDSACAQVAVDNCPECNTDLPACGDFDAGSCFVAHPTPACDDFECCTFVCAFFDPFCCDQEWDASCVDNADAFCQ